MRPITQIIVWDAIVAYTDCQYDREFDTNDISKACGLSYSTTRARLLDFVERGVLSMRWSHKHSYVWTSYFKRVYKDTYPI